MTINRTHSQYVNNGATSVPFHIPGKNKIINGDFGIWQRGTSFGTSGSLSYNCDRFLSYMDGNGTATTSQQTFTPGSAPVAGYESAYFLRQAVTSKGTSTYIQWETRIEDVRTFAGQTVTLSFWARVNSGTVSPLNIQFFQSFGSGGSAAVYTSLANATLTSSWARYSVTFTLPSISGKTIGTGSYLGLDVWLPFSTTTSVDYWGVQLEAGSVATPFTTTSGSIGGELALCQRYYYRTNATTQPNTRFSTFAPANSSTTIYLANPFPVTMRTIPTSVDYANIVVYDNVTVGASATITADTTNTNPNMNSAVITSSGMTQYRNYTLLGNGSSAYIGWNAEL